MKVLLIGGTGTISSSVARLLAESGADLTLLNRGNHPELIPTGAKLIRADIHDEKTVAQKLKGQNFDAVADFQVFTPDQAVRDLKLFSGKTRQYLFLSSASAYCKPPVSYPVTESDPLRNPYWRYARDKIACEEVFMGAFRSDGFPVTIVRPSHTYSDRAVPVAVHGKKGSWQVLRRMLDGKPVIVPGDGLTLWTLTHADDFARGFCGLLGNPHAVGQAVHITGDEALTWDEIYRDIGEALGVKPVLVHIPSDFLAAFNPELLGSLLGDKAWCMVFDNTKIKRLVPGFRARIRFSDGARRAVRYVSDHPECRIPDPDFDSWCDKVISAHFSGLRQKGSPSSH